MQRRVEANSNMLFTMSTEDNSKAPSITFQDQQREDAKMGSIELKPVPDMSVELKKKPVADDMFSLRKVQKSKQSTNILE